MRPWTGFHGPCIQLASRDLKRGAEERRSQGAKNEFILCFSASGLLRSLSLGAVAQLGERLICIQEVAGSIPTSSTMDGEA